MRTSLMLAALVSLSLAACADQDTTYEGEVLPGKTVQKTICPTGCSDDVQTSLENGEWAPLTKNSFINLHTAVPGTSQCHAESLTGGCQFACDPAKFIETLPVGTCAALRCDFADGGEVVLGGCHN